MRIHQYLLLCAASFFAFYAIPVNAVEKEDPVKALALRVMDAETEAPVAGVEVMCRSGPRRDESLGRTDEEGRLVIEAPVETKSSA